MSPIEPVTPPPLVRHPRGRAAQLMRSIHALALLFLLLAPAAAAQEPVFDVHVHLHDAGRSLGSYRAQLEEAGLQHAGFGAMWFGGPNQAPRGDIASVRAHNDALLGLARRTPGMLPIATVHPYDGAAALEELARVAALGVKVLKIHAHTQRFDVADPRVLALVRRAGELGVVVLMDNAGIRPGDNEQLFNLAIQSPGTTFVLAHIGGLGFRFWNVLALARTADDLFMDNVYFDLSATAVLVVDSPLEEEFVWTLRNVGTDRVLLGSDYPQLSRARSLDALERLDLDADEKAAIRHGNAHRLFGLGEAR